MKASDEEWRRSIDYPGVLFCGWGVRPESALEVAGRLQDLNRRLLAIDPSHGDLWPLLASRAIRPAVDPGPILQMSREDLAKVIDRRARTEPPQLPAPVGDEGYFVNIVTLYPYIDRRRLDVTVCAGAITEYERNLGDAHYHPDHPVWVDPEVRWSLIAAFVEALQPDWATAAKIVGSNEVNQQLYAPWLTWVAPGRKTPRVFLEHAGPPSETCMILGGERRIWPEPQLLTTAPSTGP